ncbi:ABC transporter substrate-binding protein, partial [Paenibacillus sp. MCAF20]
LAACSNNSKNESPASSDSPTTSADSNSVTKDPFEITMAMPVFGSVSKDFPLIEDELNKITKEKINATVKILPISIGAWQQQMNLMTAGGEKLDMYFSFGVGYPSDVTTGKVIELDNLMDQYGQDLKKQFDPQYLESAKVNGKTYGVPVLKDYTTGIPGIVMRKDLVEKHHIDVASIKTIDDLDNVFKTINDNEQTISPLAIGLTLPSDQYIWYDKVGDGLGVLPGFDNDLKLVNLYDTKEYENYLNNVHGWFKAGYINKDAATSSSPGLDYMKAGKAFSYFFLAKVGAVQAQSRLVGQELVFAPLLPNVYSTTSDVLTGLWTISANSTNPERTMMFMNLMYSDPRIANLLLWGVEGKHYVKQDNNQIDYPQGMDNQSVGYSNQDWLIGNSFLTYTYKTEDADKWKKTVEANKAAIKSKALGFAFNSEPLKTEITAIQNVMGQYRKGLESGSIDPAAKLEEFRGKLKTAGLEKVIAEKQKQLDAWAAAQ